MTKIRYMTSIVLVLLFVGATVFASGNSISLYLDIASLILVIIVPFFIVTMVFPISQQRQFFRAIFQGEGADLEKVLKQAVAFYKFYRRILISNAVIWTIMGAIAIGAHLEGPEALGMNFGVLMIVPFYTAIYLLCGIEPLRASAEKVQY